MLTVSAFMRTVAHVEANKSPRRKRRSEASYRAARRNEAKGLRADYKAQKTPAQRREDRDNVRRN